MSRCDCCYCKAQRKETRVRKQSMKCLTKGCPGSYKSTMRTDNKGLRIHECNVCKGEAI